MRQRKCRATRPPIPGSPSTTTIPARCMQQAPRKAIAARPTARQIRHRAQRSMSPATTWRVRLRSKQVPTPISMEWAPMARPVIARRCRPGRARPTAPNGPAMSARRSSRRPKAAPAILSLPSGARSPTSIFARFRQASMAAPRLPAMASAGAPQAIPSPITASPLTITIAAARLPIPISTCWAPFRRGPRPAPSKS